MKAKYLSNNSQPGLSQACFHSSVVAADHPSLLPLALILDYLCNYSLFIVFNLFSNHLFKFYLYSFLSIYKFIFILCLSISVLQI